jgi:hypothetical protein
VTSGCSCCSASWRSSIALAAERALLARFGTEWSKLYAQKRATSLVEVPPP